jgi:pimeloyl-ACP methyl ester carboxylesterase
VVLVHGFGVSGSYFVPLAKQLSGDFDVYVPDLPGHGRSGSPRTPLGVSQLADGLIAWMDAMQLPRVSVIGNSMGCQIAVDAAVRFPERFDRLALIGPTIDPAAPTFAEQARRLVVSGLFERLSLYPILAVDYGRMGWRLLPELRSMLRDRIDEKLPHVAAPIMLIRGANDRIVPPRWLEEAARLAQAERVVVIPRWGHAVHHADPRQVAAELSPFLK